MILEPDEKSEHNTPATAGLRAKYGLSERRPLLLHSMASVPAPQSNADASCTVKQVPAVQVTDPKPDSMNSCEPTEGTLSGNDVPASGQDQQAAAPAPSERHIPASDGVASSAQMQVPVAALISGEALHEGDCQPSSSTTEDAAVAAGDLPDQAALQASYRRNADAAVSTPQLRQLSQLLSRNGFPALHDEVRQSALCMRKQLPFLPLRPLTCMVAMAYHHQGCCLCRTWQKKGCHLCCMMP